MPKIILIQHCQSEHHITNMSGGWTDSKLTPFGCEQAKKIGICLRQKITASDEFVLYSSDLSRASQTADIISEHLNLDIHFETGLRELNTGIAIGKSKEWAKNNCNPFDNNQFSIDHRLFDEGESWREFFHRISITMNQITSIEKDKHLIIVTHGGTLGYIVAWWLKFTPEMLHHAYFQSDVGSITQLSKNNFEQHVLSIFNDTSHLVKTGGPK